MATSLHAAEHIAHHDPRAVLARVEAERAMVQRLHDQLEWLPTAGSGLVGALGDQEASVYRELLRWHAYGHRFDIPGYDPTWAPQYQYRTE